MQSIEFLTKDGVGITCNRQGYLTGLSLNGESTSVRLSDFCHGIAKLEFNTKKANRGLTLILDDKLDYSMLMDKSYLDICEAGTDDMSVCFTFDISELTDENIINILYLDDNFLMRYMVVGDTDRERELNEYLETIMVKYGCSLDDIPDEIAISLAETYPMEIQTLTDNFINSLLREFICSISLFDKSKVDEVRMLLLVHYVCGSVIDITGYLHYLGIDTKDDTAVLLADFFKSRGISCYSDKLMKIFTLLLRYLYGNDILLQTV